MLYNEDRDLGEPTAAELDAIDAEWPKIEAELAVLDAQIAALTALHRLSGVDWRRPRRAQERMLHAATATSRSTVSTAESGVTTTVEVTDTEVATRRGAASTARTGFSLLGVAA